ncbi:hypothetical protein M0R45_000609 [Rubus argutus]|uniref:Uncharacterized protein n=1 Tax=Rubus argutus TaxID=59490 RepID=A0AAW1VK92_RUBAR
MPLDLHNFLTEILEVPLLEGSPPSSHSTRHCSVSSNFNCFRAGIAPVNSEAVLVELVGTAEAPKHMHGCPRGNPHNPKQHDSPPP